MKKQIASLSILFADISNSSNIYELLGDKKAQELIGIILKQMTDITIQFSGKVIKTVGDAVISTFHSTDEAIEAAKSMQDAMIFGIPTSHDFPPVNIHIGVHYGPVVIDNKDIFGDAVNITSRVVDYANPRQIVATRAAVDNLNANSCHIKKFLTKITAKNITGEIELYEMIFQDEQTTMVMDSQKLSEALCSSLFLMKGGQVIVVDAQKPVISVGREDFNDLVIQYSWISRTHAYFENRNGIFMLKDKSTNGTYVYPDNGEPIHVNKGDHPLSGKGTIIFGRQIENNLEKELTDTVEYDVK